MAKKTGAGTGLGALYNDKTTVENTDKPFQISEVEQISLSLIDLNRDQPRKTFNNESLEELATSIKNVGIIQPLVLSKEGDRYLIIAGERRYRASLKAGLKSVPAVVKSFTEREKREISLIENLQREDLNPIEEALALKALIDEYNMTQEELASRIGKSRPVISNALRLLQLDPFVINLVKEGRLSSGHARALVSLKDRDVQIKYAQASCDKKISVNDLEKMVSAYINPTRPPVKIKPPIALELKELLKKLQSIFSTKISGVGTVEKGRIYIDYYTKDDLERIYYIISKLED